MDFWASLEHKIYYKFEGNAPQYISRDLRECPEIVSMLDAKMLQLNGGDHRGTCSAGGRYGCSIITAFEAASLLFMLLIFVHFMVVWQFPTEKTRVFRALLIVCIGESAFNILSSIGLANAGVVPQIVNEIFAFVFFV